MSRRWLKSVSIAVGVWCLASLLMSRAVAAADTASLPTKPDHLARILIVTESEGFQHSSVKRPEAKKEQSKAPQLSTAERTVTELGLSSGLFKVDCTQDSAKDFMKEKLDTYGIVLFHRRGR